MSGDEFRAWLKENDLTAYALSKMLGLTQQAVLNWCNTGLALVNAYAIAAVMKGLTPIGGERRDSDPNFFIEEID